MVVMGVVVGIGVAMIVMVAIGYVSAYASAEGRIHAEHKTLLRSHERLQQAFDPRRFPLQYRGNTTFGDLYGSPELDQNEPIVVFFRNGRPFRAPNGQLPWVPVSAQVQTRTRDLPQDMHPTWTTPERICQAIVTTPKVWSRQPIRVRRIY